MAALFSEGHSDEQKAALEVSDLDAAVLGSQMDQRKGQHGIGPVTIEYDFDINRLCFTLVLYLFSVKIGDGTIDLQNPAITLEETVGSLTAKIQLSTNFDAKCLEYDLLLRSTPEIHKHGVVITW